MTGDVAHVVMKGGDIALADIADSALAEAGEDARIDDPAVKGSGVGLQMGGGVFVHEAPGEVGHGRASSCAGCPPCHIATSLREGDDLGSLGPRDGRGDGSVGSDGDFDGASLVAVLDDVDLSPGRVDTDTEALDVVIPDDALGGAERIDGPRVLRRSGAPL